jgi:hypothetical protein
MDEFKRYLRKATGTEYAEMRPYVPGENVPHIVLTRLTEQGQPAPCAGDMIQRNPIDHADQWLVPRDHFDRWYNTKWTPPMERPLTGVQDHIMQFFAYEHLPEQLQKVSMPFCELARLLVNDVTGLPRNQERTVALRKLLEAKDAAVRASIAQ